jgi:hypothetical protein
MKVFSPSLSIIFALVIILTIFFIYLFLHDKIRKNYIGVDVFRENYENSSTSTINPYEDYKMSELINILIKINSDYQYIINKLNEMKNNKTITDTTYRKMTVKLDKILISAFETISSNINVNAEKFKNIINGTYDPLNVSSSSSSVKESFTENPSRGDLRRNALHPNPSSPNALQSSTLQSSQLSPSESFVASSGSSVPPVGSSVPPSGSSVPPSGSSVPPVGSFVPSSGSSVPSSGSFVPSSGSSLPPVGSSVFPSGSSVPPGGSSVPSSDSSVLSLIGSSVPPIGSSVPPIGSSVPHGGSSSLTPSGSSLSMNYDSNKKTYYIQQLLIPVIQGINNELQKLNDIKNASDDPAKITQMASVM